MNYFANIDAGMYTSCTSNEVEIGVSVDPAAKAALFEHAAFCFVAPFLVAHSRSPRTLQLLLRRVTGTPTRLGYLPDWRRSGSRLSTDPSEATMAPSSHKPELTHERLREALNYDPDTGNFQWRTRPSSHFNTTRAWNAWNARFSGKETGSDHGDGYIVLRLDYIGLRAHRIAWFYMTGEMPSDEIDHINQDPSDNRFSNLRVVSRAVNQQNQRRAQCSNKSTGLLGSHKHADGRFVASIRVDGRQIYLGLFDTAELAHAAYVNAKRELHEGCTI